MNNEKILKIKPIDSSLKEKCIADSLILPFGISPSGFVNIQTMKIISSYTKITKKLSTIPKEMILQSFLKYFSQLIKE